MNSKKTSKTVREGQYMTEVEVELLDDGTGWAPYLSAADARKLDDVRDALRRHDLKAAAKLAKVYELTPVPHAAEQPAAIIPARQPPAYNRNAPAVLARCCCSETPPARFAAPTSARASWPGCSRCRSTAG